MKYILGIDQGGTKTHAMVADTDGHILGVGKGRGACHSIHGMERAMAAVMDATEQAVAAAGITIGDLWTVSGGMTGIDWPDEADLVRNALHQTLHVPVERITVVNDSMIALRAGTSSPKGVILVAGTGMNCAVVDGKGGQYTFGFYIPDKDQGGLALSNRTLQAVFDAACGMGPETALTESVLKLTGCVDVDELLRRNVTGRVTTEEIRQLPLLLDAAAIAGDPVAKDVLRIFGKDATAYVKCGLTRMRMEREEVEVVLSGSVFKCRAAELLGTVKEEILRFNPLAHIVESEHEPIIGAVLLALDALPGGVTQRMTEHIKRDALRFDMVRTPSEKGEEKT